MSLTSQELDAISSNSFLLECIEIRLTQNIEVNPICYSGAGSIYQKPNGTLQLKIYHAYKSDKEIQSELKRAVNPQSVPGKLLPPGEYFSLIAKDIKGREWAAENIYVPKLGFSIPAVGKVIHADISEIRFTSDRHPHEDCSKNFVTSHIQGKYRLPFNDRETIKSTFSESSSLNICKLKLANEEYVIHQRNEYVAISLQTSFASDVDVRFRIFLEALGIGVGHYLKPSYQCIAINNKRIISVYSAPTKTTQEYLPPPIPGQLYQSHELESFIVSYIDFFSVPFESYFGYWYRILKSFSGEIENRALVITTAIEGILKEYYSNHGAPDEEFIQQVKESVPKINDLNIGSRVKDRILTTLGQAQSITASNILYKLAADKVISDQMVKVWKEARNKATHADSLKLSDSDIQNYLDQSYICLALFYRLLLKSLGYKSKFIDYSKDNWPTLPN